MDWIRVSMAGGLKDFTFTDYTGNESATGESVRYGKSQAGYAVNPWESVNYASKHDNQTLFDLITYTSTGKSDMKLQTRQQALGLATAILGQGVFFDQQGSDLLRSKSFENDSYNSGDFINAVNYKNYETNGYSNKDKDEKYWGVVKQLYEKIKEETDQKPFNAGLQGRKSTMSNYYQELLSIRQRYREYISLGSAEDIRNCVTFLNSGKDQTIGLIAMEIKKSDQEKLLVVINATPEVQDLTQKQADSQYKRVEV